MHALQSFDVRGQIHNIQGPLIPTATPLMDVGAGIPKCWVLALGFAGLGAKPWKHINYKAGNMHPRRILAGACIEEVLHAYNTSGLDERRDGNAKEPWIAVCW